MPRRALVTGASRGIGRAIASRYESAGYAVLAPTRAEMDLASPSSIRDYLDRLGDMPIDVLVNDAAENRIRTLSELSLEEWQRMQAINLTAAFLLIKHLGTRMAERKWGRIVNISSCYSLVSRAGRAGYTASKSGLNGLTMTAALELAHGNVLVNAVCPGFADTELTRQNNSPGQIEAICGQVPLGRMARPEEIAEVVFFLGSEVNTYATGQTFTVDGGFLIQ